MVQTGAAEAGIAAPIWFGLTRRRIRCDILYSRWLQSIQLKIIPTFLQIWH